MRNQQLALVAAQKDNRSHAACTSTSGYVQRATIVLLFSRPTPSQHILGPTGTPRTFRPCFDVGNERSPLTPRPLVSPSVQQQGIRPSAFHNFVFPNGCRCLLLFATRVPTIRFCLPFSLVCMRQMSSRKANNLSPLRKPACFRTNARCCTTLKRSEKGGGPAAGVQHDTPSQTYTFQVPVLPKKKKNQNSTREERMKIVAGEGKKERNFGQSGEGSRGGESGERPNFGRTHDNF